jgi:hypothetical protein
LLTAAILQTSPRRVKSNPEVFHNFPRIRASPNFVEFLHRHQRLRIAEYYPLRSSTARCCPWSRIRPGESVDESVEVGDSIHFASEG